MTIPRAVDAADLMALLRDFGATGDGGGSDAPAAFVTQANALRHDLSNSLRRVFESGDSASRVRLAAVLGRVALLLSLHRESATLSSDTL